MKRKNSEIRFRIPVSIKEQMLKDLRRRHPYAYERAGFLFTKSKRLKNDTVIIVATDYVPIADEDYIKDESVGARINSEAIRKSMQGIYERKGGCFHVHLHDHKGSPTPSGTDIKGLPGVAESFANISGEQLNGYLILSEDSFYASVKIKGKKQFQQPKLITEVGYPMRFHFNDEKRKRFSEVFSRQSFLGKDSQYYFENIKVAIIGYGGGGSHIGQQLAHIGVLNVTVFDDDKIELSNLNRLIGGWFTDVKKALLKTSIAKRVSKKIQPLSKVICVNVRWQDEPELLEACDIAVGGVDTYSERQQLEAECRRYLIPYIDVGMDVYKDEEGNYSMPGQVILSMPGKPCMRCYGFITEEKLGEEAAKYGATGGRPQVVWPNGVLASTAVGILVDIVTNWTQQKDKNIYLSYDGNAGHVIDHLRLRFAPKDCSHFPLSDIGPANFKKL